MGRPQLLRRPADDEQRRSAGKPARGQRPLAIISTHINQPYTQVVSLYTHLSIEFIHPIIYTWGHTTRRGTQRDESPPRSTQRGALRVPSDRHRSPLRHRHTDIRISACHRTDKPRSTVPHARHANETGERKHSKCANSAHAQPAQPQKQANPKVCARGGWLLATPRPSH